MADSKESGTSSTPNEMADGIYLIKKVGSPVLFEPGCNKDACIAVGIKMGSKSIALALKDAADGEYTTLTNSKDKTEYDGYIDNYTDAVADWNGKSNTKHLEQIGLNKNIILEDGQYIPAMGQMLFIFLNKKALNEALKYVGGQIIADAWYWTSTEDSATDAWHLTLFDGTMGNGTKSTTTGRVRPVSAFIS